jgi:hypothetical protein
LPAFEKPRPLLPTFERFFNYFQKAFERFSKAFERLCSVQGRVTFVSSKVIIKRFSYINTTSIELWSAYFESIFVNSEKYCIAPKCRLCFQKWQKWAV